MVVVICWVLFFQVLLLLSQDNVFYLPWWLLWAPIEWFGVLIVMWAFGASFMATMYCIDQMMNG
jgi:hypothetical protein